LAVGLQWGWKNGILSTALEFDRRQFRWKSVYFMTPEQKAREQIDRQLELAGWIVQDYAAMNIAAGLGVAVREFPLTTGHADYLLYADCKAIGVVEAEP